jgi:TP53 regulating kinase-like protein
MITLPEQLEKLSKQENLIAQGAESLVYFAQHPYLPQQECIVKYRPKKPYRLPELDAQLSKHRTLAEARVLQKLALGDVEVPHLVFIDAKNGLIYMEKIEGLSVKQWIWNEEGDTEGGAQEAGDKSRSLPDGDVSSLKDTLVLVGQEIGKLHKSDIVHGDLTTSNVMLRDGKPVIIDFGLASVSTLAEDKAVDLYVMERAVLSTHPVHSQQYCDWLFEGYLAVVGKSQKEVMRKLEDVRQRGRKRSMLG